MQDHALAHAQQVDPFLAVILAIIEALDRKAVAERFDRVMEGDTMGAPIRGCLGVIPFKFVIPHSVLIISSGFKSRGLARCRARLRGSGVNEWSTIIGPKLTALHDGKIRRLVINLPPRHLKSLLASVAFPAWCPGHDPSAQILCVSYAQDLADKLARDCRSIMMSRCYRRMFPTRLAPHRHAVQAFITT